MLEWRLRKAEAVEIEDLIRKASYRGFAHCVL